MRDICWIQRVSYVAEQTSRPADLLPHKLGLCHMPFSAPLVLLRSAIKHSQPVWGLEISRWDLRNTVCLSSRHLDPSKHKAFCYVLYCSIGETLALCTPRPYRNCYNETSCSILPFFAIHSFTHLAICCIFLPQPWILNQLGLSSGNLW